MKIRRVVTGHDVAGRSVFVADEEVEPDGWHLWGAGQTPMLSSDGVPPGRLPAYPPVRGYRVGVIELSPGVAGATPYPDEEYVKEAKRYGMRLEVDQPGFHTTDTADFEVVLSGQIVLEFDDGARRLRQAGDPSYRTAPAIGGASRELNLQ